MRFINKRVIKKCVGFVANEKMNRILRGVCEHVAQSNSNLGTRVFLLSEKRFRTGSISRIRYRCIFSNSPNDVYQALRCSRYLVWKGGSLGSIVGLRGKLW